MHRKFSLNVVWVVGAALAFAKPSLASIDEFQSIWAQIERGSTEWQSPAMSGHILEPELHIEMLRRSSDAPSAAEQDRLLGDYRAYHSTQRLRRHWLNIAAKQQDWARTIALYQPGDGTSAQCAYELARVETQRPRPDQIQRLFIDGARGEHCEDLFSKAKARDWISPWARAEKTQKLLSQGRYSQALELARELGPINLRRAEQYKLSRTQPAEYLRQHPQGQWRKHAIRAEIARDPVGAGQWLNQSEADLREWRAVHLILDSDPATQAALDQLRRPLSTRSLREWEVRWHLRNGNWQQVRQRIEEMPPALRAGDTWRYWHAMALERLGQNADDLFRQLASSRSFYGLMAADHLGLEYPQYNPRPDRTVDRLTRQPEVQIAGALFEAGLVSRARSQWRAYWRQLPLAERQAATTLAWQWGFASEEVRGAVNSRQTDTLHMYPDALRSVMSAKPIDADWLLGLTRTESLFQTDVRSRAGALGLMQLMPATGQQQAARLGLEWSGPASLTDPAVNIQLGSDYLHRMYLNFGQNALVATAAYNAGPNAVSKWLSDPTMDPAIWVETLPFKETRNYVKKVMYAATVYNQALGSRDRRLSDRMTPLPTPNG